VCFLEKKGEGQETIEIQIPVNPEAKRELRIDHKGKYSKTNKKEKNNLPGRRKRGEGEMVPRRILTITLP